MDKFWTGAGDGQQSRRQMLRDCLERHGGDSLVAGQVADILEGLVLQGDSGASSFGVGRQTHRGCWGVSFAALIRVLAETQVDEADRVCFSTEMEARDD